MLSYYYLVVLLHMILVI